jgi:Fe(3+) dicitrate transport protein
LKNLLVILTIAIAAAASAQEASISGRVLSSKGFNPVPYMNVAISPSKGTMTNEDGYFTFKNIDPGIYTLHFIHLSYHDSVLTNIELKEGQQLKLPNLIFHEKAIMIDEITVTSYNTNYSPKFSGSSNVITHKEIKQLQPLGTEEVLKAIPGVNVSGDMGISNRLNIGIRGSYPRRAGNILVLEDGIPIAPAPYLAPEAYYCPPSDRLDGMEIIKGVDILTYGNNSMYGAVNFITKKPPVRPTLMANLAGGNNEYLSQYITYGGTWNKLGAELQILNKSFGGFMDNSGSKIFNTTVKTFAELSPKSSVYLKANYHQENSNASYSALTPLTFSLDPTKNPFDSDDLKTNRKAADMIFNHSPIKNLVFTTQLYTAEFVRDWWRQNPTLIKAKDAENYLGEEIFNSKYSYLKNQEFTDDDWIRVGRVTGANKRESTTARNRLFKFAGAQQSVRYEWNFGSIANMTEAGLKYHAEFFNNQEFVNDSSRWARSGRTAKNQEYTLGSASGYVKNTFAYGKFSFAPVLRYENITMTENDVMKNATNPATAENPLILKNTFSEFLPGAGINYKMFNSDTLSLSLFAGIYKGFTPPTSSAGFVAVEDGIVKTKPSPEEINMKSETSMNIDFGVQGYAFGNAVSGQIAGFRNDIRNFYSAGRQEAFQTLGNVIITGIESGVDINIDKIIPMGNSKLKIGSYTTLMNSRIASGRLLDSDLLNAKHTDATKAELIDKINSERDGYVIHTKDSILTGPVSLEQFKTFSKIEMIFGENGISNNQAPYIPNNISNFKVDYVWKNLAAGVVFNYVSSQFTDYLNFKNETAEGAIGRLDDYSTLDLNFSYNFYKIGFIENLIIHSSVKNLNNDIYKASRLHRVSSGIMPGGFRQINFGIKFQF